MRRTPIIAILAGSLSAAAFGQTQVSIFYNHSLSSSSHHGYGVGLKRAWTPRFSTALSFAAEESVVSFCVGGIVTPQRCREVALTAYPIDLNVRLQFPTDTRWQPFVGAGLRYVAAPDLTPEELQIVGKEYSGQLNGEVVGGFDFFAGSRFGLSVDLKGLVGDTEDYNSTLTLAGGVFWRF